MSKSNDKNIMQFYNYLDKGFQLVVATGVEYATFIADKPGIAVLAAALGVSFQAVFNTVLDISKRQLSSRERSRSALVALYVIDSISARILSGKELRNDDFFSYKGDKPNRSPAEEIMEGIMLKAKNEHEEKKLRFIANIIVNVSFTEDCLLHEANNILKIAERLSYTQMCLLEIRRRIGKHRGSHPHDIMKLSKALKAPSFEQGVLVRELEELVSLGLLETINKMGAIPHIAQVEPFKVKLSQTGERYVDFMGLSDIQKEDLFKTAEILFLENWIHEE